MAIMIESEPILHKVFQQDEQVAYFAQDYLRYNALTLPAVYLWMVAAQMISSFASNKTSLIGPITFAIGLFLAIGLGLGKMGMPKIRKISFCHI